MSGQQARREARDTEKSLSRAGDRLIAAILSEPAIIDAVAKTRIDTLVEAGELIPVERLTLGPGLELHPAGRMAELETAIIEALDLLEADQGRKAMMALLKVMPDPEPEVEDEVEAEVEPDVVDEPDDDDDVDDEPSPIAEAVAKLSQPDEPEVVEAPVEPDGRPKGMPRPDETRPCEKCGQEVPFEQSSMSWTRFRRVLCRPDFEAFDPQAEADALAAAATPEPAPAP